MALQRDTIKLGEPGAQHIKSKVTQIMTKHLTYLYALLTSKWLVVILKTDPDIMKNEW